MQNTTLSLRAPVLVLGAGLMGRLLALTLTQAGHPVRIIDTGPPDGSGAAAWVAAAMLAPLAESAITELNVVAMGQYALTRWPSLIAGLRRPVFFQQNGTLILWHRQDAPEARRFSGLLAATGQACRNYPSRSPLTARASPAWSPPWPGASTRGSICRGRPNSTTANCWGP
jgi:glycine oxidase